MIVLQEWIHKIHMMQQTVLLTAIRGPDGLPKYGCVKMLLRWYRRCILLSAMDGRALTDPYESNGGSFTGPSLDGVAFRKYGEQWERGLDEIVDEYMKTLDAIPHHFQMHFLHAAEIIGYKHPDKRIAEWWRKLYDRLVNDFHLHPETCEQMDTRLGDSREGWLARADKATIT